MRVERHGVRQVVWPAPSGDGEESLIPWTPRRPARGGAFALPLPEEPHPAG